MAIKVTNGFEVRSKNPIDTRLTLTKEQMRNINDKLMPDKYFTTCLDDGQIYVFKKDLEVPREDTGKFITLAEANNLQEKLISGENIKTINGFAVLGNGDLEIDSIPLTDDEINNICK